MNKKGFLLVELIVSLTAFSVMLLIFGYFFLYITTSYKYTQDRLHGMLHVQNGIERSWINQDQNTSQGDSNGSSAQRAPLPLPDRGIDLPHTILPLDYYGWSLSAKSNTQEETVMPGCVCEK
jgi:hypothetical protein